MTVAVSRTEHVQDRVTDPATGQFNVGTYQIRLGSRHGVVVARTGSLRQPQTPRPAWQPIKRPAPVSPSGPGSSPSTEKTIESVQVADFAAIVEMERRLLQTLAALNNAPLSSLRLAKLTGTNDVSPAITNLLSRGWLRTDQQRYWLAPGLNEKLLEAYDLNTLRAWALMHFSRVIKEQLTPANLTDLIEAIAELVTWTIQAERWSDTIRLVVGIEKTLVLSHSWKEWRQMLNQALIASTELDEQSRQAWAWHQLGSLALFQQDLQTARTALRRALQIRQSLGEMEAVALTRANLKETEVISSAPPLLTEHLRLPLLAGLILGLAIVTSYVIWGGGQSAQASTPETLAASAVAGVNLPSPSSTPLPRQDVQESFVADQSVVAERVLETPLPSPTPCTISAPARWQKTAIRRGDTLSKLAAAHRTAVDRIMSANCLPNDMIIAGSQLWLPPLPPTPTPTIPPANLLIDGLWLNGPPTAGSEAIIVPVAFSLANDGGRPADYGIVSLSYSTESSGQRTPISFDTAVAPAAVEAGGRVPAVAGTVAFSPKLANQMVTLWVAAHSERSVPVNLSLPSPVVRIEAASGGSEGMTALLFNEGSEQWYTEMSLAGRIDNEAAFQVQSWEWRNGGTVIGTGPAVTVQLSSDTTCIPYNITLTVTVAYFGGAYTMSESAGIRSDCASN
jgi:LysM repeat protein